MLRRSFLTHSAGGVGLLALAQLLAADRPVAAGTPASHGAVRGPATRARSVICLFQHGGPSQVDLFDPKPALGKWDGKPYPNGKLEIHAETQSGNVLASPFKFRRHGKSGIELSELLPHLGSVIDDVTLIRSMTTPAVDHEAALRCFHTGRRDAGFPTWGSWVTYALGTDCQDLPAYIVLSDPGGLPIDGIRNWSAGWLPTINQGTALGVADRATVHLQPPAAMPQGARQEQLAFLNRLNRHHLSHHPLNDDLAARIQNFELAAQMQTSVPDLVDVSGETQATQQMYGLDRQATMEYGRRCLIARRMVERGVRFVQISQSGQPWDTHSDNANGLVELCAKSDQPCAALVRDLKQRGLLESTIVIWAGEFGRLPIAQGVDGRDHNRHGFSIWIAGGGFRPGYVHGATCEFGYSAVEDPVTVHDLHATLLHALGLDHRRLAYPREGRETSLTDAEVTQARVVDALL